MVLTDQQKEALIIAGGCTHNPNPFQSCDTCGRAVAIKADEQHIPHKWSAETTDNKIITKRDVSSTINLPVDVDSLTLYTDSPVYPVLRAKVNSKIDQKIRTFTRHVIQLNGNMSKISITVIEIVPDPSKPDQFVRLYMHPTLGPIISTLDINF